MITVSTSMDKWRGDVEYLRKHTFPRIVSEAINEVASFAHAQSIRNQKAGFVKFSRYTERSMRFYKASPKANIARINAITGSISPYLDKQDAGGETRPITGGSVPVPTLAARRGSVRNAIASRFRMANMGNFGKTPFFMLRPASPVRVLREAAIFYRKSKRRIVKIRNLERGAVKIKAMKWHQSAMRKIGSQANMTAAFRRALNRRG